MGDAFVKQASLCLVLDSSRRVFIHECGRTLWQLSHGILKNNNAMRRLLLGRKGVGKSFLLTFVKEACETHFKEICCVYMRGLGALNFFKVLADSLKHEPINSLQDLERSLESTHKKLFLIVDELQFIYSYDQYPRPEGPIEFLEALADSRSGNVHCIISGSSSNMRRLCFAKLREEEKKKYPAYRGTSLNSTRFVPMWILPFVQAEDFLCLVDFFVQQQKVDSSAFDDDRIRRLFFGSAGIPRSLQNMVASNSGELTDSWATSSKEPRSADQIALLDDILQRVQEQIVSEEYDRHLSESEQKRDLLRPFTDWMKFVTEALSHHCARSMRDV